MGPRDYVHEVRSGLLVADVIPALNNDWIAWSKPKNCKTLFIGTLGAGAGGAGSFVNTGLNSARGGSGGGGSGNFACNILASMFLPDVLFCRPGAGGKGGAGGANGNGGNPSWVSVTEGSSAAADLVCLSGGGSNGGLIGTNVAGGSGGNLEGAPAATAAAYFGLGIAIRGTGGEVGGSGGTPTAGAPTGGSAVDWGDGSTGPIVNTGGAGGGATDTNNIATTGGVVNGFGRVPSLLTTGAGGSTAAATTGVPGIGVGAGQGIVTAADIAAIMMFGGWGPFAFLGAPGGNSLSNQASATGGNGGQGFYSCGGGGAGAGATTNATNGIGGNGGDGLIFILGW